MGDFRSDLEPEVERTETLILKVVREVVPCAYLKRIGPINFNPPAWSCWIVTSTDAERDALANDAELNQRIADAAKRVFLPAASPTNRKKPLREITRAVGSTPSDSRAHG